MNIFNRLDQEIERRENKKELIKSRILLAKRKAKESILNEIEELEFSIKVLNQKIDEIKLSNKAQQSNIMLLERNLQNSKNSYEKRREALIESTIEQIVTSAENTNNYPTNVIQSLIIKLLELQLDSNVVDEMIDYRNSIKFAQDELEAATNSAEINDIKEKISENEKMIEILKEILFYFE